MSAESPSSPEVVLDWLGPADHGWLAALIEAFAGADGLRRREVEARVRAARCFEAGKKRGPAEDVLWALSSARPAPRGARELRERLFTLPGEPVPEVAASLGATVDELWDLAFADVPGERIFVAPTVGVEEVVLRANLAMLQTALRSAVALRVVLWGNAHDVVRHVRLTGLLCVARRVPAGVQLDISGAYALFRRTTLYGRAQASVVPRLRWCARFSLEAHVVVDGAERVLRHGPADPVWASPPPRRFDSRVEERFEREWLRACPEFGIVRNPEAIEVAGRLVFPDFAVWRTARPDVRWLVEIVGWWTPDYVRGKLEAFGRMGLEGVVLCVDAARNLGDAELPEGVAVVRYTKRVRAADVLAAIAAMPGGTRRVGVRTERLGQGEYFLDWAGRRRWEDAVHERIARVRPGSEARLEVRDGSLCVVAEGGPVAVLSASARRRWEPRLGRVAEVWVRSLAERRREMSGVEWREWLQVERWRVPLVDVSWRPG